jgi:hypothetical protein
LRSYQRSGTIGLPRVFASPHDVERARLRRRSTIPQNRWAGGCSRRFCFGDEISIARQ